MAVIEGGLKKLAAPKKRDKMGSNNFLKNVKLSKFGIAVVCQVEPFCLYEANKREAAVVDAMNNPTGYKLLETDIVSELPPLLKKC